MQELNIHYVEKKKGYQFKNTDLLFQAFTRPSYTYLYGGSDNQIMEFIGDKVLNLYVTRWMVLKFCHLKRDDDAPTMEADAFTADGLINEGDFSILSQMVTNKVLEKRIDTLGIARFMYLGQCDRRNGTIVNQKFKADLFESILGAVALDSDWDPESLQHTLQVMLDPETLFKYVEEVKSRPKKYKRENAINTLEYFYQIEEISKPVYTFSDTNHKTKDGKLMWTCTCFVDSWNISKTAIAKKKIAAKRYSAYLVLGERFGYPDEFA